MGSICRCKCNKHWQFWGKHCNSRFDNDESNGLIDITVSDNEYDIVMQCETTQGGMDEIVTEGYAVDDVTQQMTQYRVIKMGMNMACLLHSGYCLSLACNDVYSFWKMAKAKRGGVDILNIHS